MKPHLSYIYSIISCVLLFVASVHTSPTVLGEKINDIINGNLAESIESFRTLQQRKLYKDELPQLVHELQNSLLLLEMSKNQLQNNDLDGALVSYGLGLYALIDDFNKTYFNQPYDLTLFNILMLWAIENYGKNFQDFKISQALIGKAGNKIIKKINVKRPNTGRWTIKLYEYIYATYDPSNCLLYENEYKKAKTCKIETEALFRYIWFYPSNLDLFNQNNGIVHAIQDLPKTTFYKYFNKDQLLLSLENCNVTKFIERMRNLTIKEKQILNVDELAMLFGYPIIFFELSNHLLINAINEEELNNIFTEAYYLYGMGIYSLIDDFCHVKFKGKFNQNLLNVILKWAIEEYGSLFNNVDQKLLQETASYVLSSKDDLNRKINRSWIEALYNHIYSVCHNRTVPKKYTLSGSKSASTEELFKEFWFEKIQG